VDPITAEGGTVPAGKECGGACVQTVAAKADDGSEHFLDGTRYAPPTFDETCGGRRCRAR
jgi:hypothetical protein